jgi:hypothetical protein
MIEVIELGAFGAHVCQALKIPAACDWRNFQETPNTRTFVRAKMRNTNCVAIPKLPPPPPLHAQNKVGFRAYCRLQRTPLAINHGHLLKNVARQSMRPGQQTVTATHHMSGNANRRATPSRKRIPFICKFLVNIIERNACAHGDNPCGGIDTDIFQTSKVDHDVL